MERNNTKDRLKLKSFGLKNTNNGKNLKTPIDIHTIKMKVKRKLYCKLYNLIDLKKLTNFKLKKLSSLTLDLGEEIFKDGNVKPLSTILKRITSLSKLSLNFGSYYGIKNKGIKRLFLSVRHLSSLSSLAINLSRSEEISDIGIQYLSSKLKYLSSLSVLTLDFSCCKDISDKAIQGLFSDLRYLKSLSIFTLNLAGCEKISQKALEKLFSGLMRVCCLSVHNMNLNLKFLSADRNKGVNDKVLEDMASGFPYVHSSLTVLNLSFNYCQQISSREIEPI